ncbi:MAG TPA: DUF3857 domain-containing protein, partial [Clostridia bacterium]|nr:DUF3857 domain-containing protein [Clostridia bacterium]
MIPPHFVMVDKFSSAARHRALALFISFLCLAANVFGQSTNVTVLPVPDWVRLCDWSVPTNRATSEKSEGSRYLVFERQENPQRQERFTRTILLMENETGVQDSGSLTVEFDPSFQELFLHLVQIHRQGKVLERLNRSKVRILQPEPDLDGHLITGRQTALLVIEDLRVGDALEYAYTLRGANPILNGHYATRLVMRSGVPVDRQRMRVVWASPQPLYLRQHLTELAPVKAECPGGTEYVWDFTNLEAIPYEDALPISYEPYPYVELSDF